MIKMTDEQMERKLKRESVEVCLNCKRFVNCQDVGKPVECDDCLEIKNESWIVKKV